MRIVTFFTKSHEVLFNRLKNSLYHTCQLANLLAFETPQRSELGNYESTGFNETMEDKLFVLRLCWDLLADDDYFVYADCDVQFFGDVEQDFANYSQQNADIYFQDDVSAYCAGFMICRKNERVRLFFEKAWVTSKRLKCHDQTAINYLIQCGEAPHVRLLPRDKYFTVAASIGAKRWTGEHFVVPAGLIMHHANWVVGIKEKIKLMDYVKQQMGDSEI